MLTEAELEIMKHLTNAWNLFTELPRSKCEEPIDGVDFSDAIHAAQKVLALRVARRADPGIWATRAVTRDDLSEDWAEPDPNAEEYRK